jgi:hypothetical protein
MSVDLAERLRRLVLALLALGLVGMGADLLALQHFEDSWQLLPLVVIGLALLTVVWYVLGGGAASLRVLQGLMASFVVVGVLGFTLHYRANMAFQLDMDPGQSSWELFQKVIHASAPPALAPAAMAQLGLLGLVYCYRHPAFAARRGAAIEGA